MIFVYNIGIQRRNIMTTLIINTQYRENYAAHNADYQHGVDEAYWKFKGGDTYFVNDISEKDAERIARDGIPTLTKLIEYSNEASEEYIIDWELREVGKGSDPICNFWETPIEFWYNKELSRWECRTFHTYTDEEYVAKPIIAKAEQWVPLNGGDRDFYSQQYKTPNGWFEADNEQLKKEVEDARAA
jgi:hypothetical protein